MKTLISWFLLDIADSTFYHKTDDDACFLCDETWEECRNNERFWDININTAIEVIKSSNECSKNIFLVSKMDR